MPNMQQDVPIHLWVIGVIALFANLLGAYDFLQSVLGSPSYFARATDMDGVDPKDAVTIVLGFPLWVKIAWGVATIGGSLASLALLRRDSWAPTIFAVSVAGIAVFTFYQAAAGIPPSVTGMTSWLFGIAIWSMAVFLTIYAYSIRKRGLLTR